MLEGAGELILIIEDNARNQKLLRDVLQVKGYRTVETLTAEEGLQAARAQLPALILMDIQLPGMDGIAALREIRADLALREIPVVAVTASAMPLDRKKIMAAGFDGYQTKPIRVKDFLLEVDTVLKQHAKQGPTEEADS